MAFLTTTSLTLKTPDLARTLVSDLTLSFGSDRTGVVGRNGCGKSTLLRVLAGQIDPAGGVVSSAGRVGFLRQRFDDLSIPIFEALGVDVAYRANARVVGGQGSAADLAIVDWALDARIDSALDKVGLGDVDVDAPLSRLSGGQRMRVSIARVILEDADLLVLDEPTNNLDGQGRVMIADLVSGWRGGVVVAGHDRALLEQMDRILELSQTGARLYVGGWSTYRARADADAAHAQAELDRATQALKATQDHIQRQHERKARRDKAGRAKRAQDNEPRVALDRQQGRAEKTSGRDKHLADRMVGKAVAAHKDAAAQVEVVAPIIFDVDAAPTHANRLLLNMDAVEFRLSETRTLGPWDLAIYGSQRVRLTGANGVGKSTLMKLAAGLLSPTGGQIVRAGQPAYLDQDLSVPIPDGRLLDNLLHAQPKMSGHDARAALARFGFRNVMADRDVSGLSGGERLRLSLCMAMSGDILPELILLDEPTNHLDTDAVALLETTLRDFAGAILFVSHDEEFANAVNPDRDLGLAP